MCNLYSMTTSKEAVLGLFRVPHNRAGLVDPLPAIFPGWNAPVIRRTHRGWRAGACEPQLGLRAASGGKAPRRVTNTRDDKVASRFWKQSIEQRRCLVPASSVCEPRDGVKPATWHWFALKGDEPRPLFAFAGIWQRWRGPIKKDGPNVEIDVYSFMTTQPNELTSSINHERSPVLLTTEEEREAWIAGSTKEALALVRPIAANRLRIVQSGLEKKDLLAAA